MVGSARTQLHAMQQQASERAHEGASTRAAAAATATNAVLQAQSAISQRVAAGNMGYQTTCDGCGRHAVGLRKCAGCTRVAYW